MEGKQEENENDVSMMNPMTQDIEKDLDISRNNPMDES